MKSEFSVEFKDVSKKFGDSLASVPGPAGAVGKAIKGLDDAFKFLIANPLVGTITIISAVLFGMYKALQQTKEGQSALNKITDAFGNILNVVIKVVSAVAIPIFEAYAKVIAFVSSAVADATGNYVEYQKELAKDDAFREAEKQAEGIKKFLDEEGFKFDELTKKKIAAKQKYYEKSRDINKDDSLNEAERNKKLNNAALELNKTIADVDTERQKNKDAADKAASDKATAAAEKAFAAKISRMSSEDKLDEAKLEKLKQEALAVATTEKEKSAIEELYSKKKYEQAKKDLIQLQSLYKKDSKEYLDYQTQLINLDTNRTKDVAAQVDKRKKSKEEENKNDQTYADLLEDLYITTFEKEEAREEAQFAAKRRREKIALTASENFIKESETRKAELLQQFDDATTLQQQERAKAREIKTLDEQLKVLELRGQVLQQGTASYYRNREELLDKAYQKERKLAEDNTALLIAIDKKYLEDKKNLKAQEIEAYGRVASATIDSFAAVTGALASALDDEAKNSEAAFNKRKKLQKATALLSAASGLIQILTQPSLLPSPFDWIVKGANAVALGIATAVNIRKIDQTTFSGGGGGASSSGASTGAASSVSANLSPQIAGPQIGVSGNQNGILAGIAAGSVGRNNSAGSPIRAYVVGNEVTTQQQLDRRIRAAARLGG